MDKKRRFIAVVKEPQYYIFTYAPGDESVLFNTVMEYVKNPELDFEWNDAILFLKRMRGILNKELKEYDDNKTL